MTELDRLRLGITATIALVILAAVVLRVLAAQSGDQTFQAEFARADGAKVGNEVRVAGIEVGEVTDVRLSGDRIVVTFSVDDTVRLGRRTEAEMKVSTLLGAYYLEVVPRGTGSLADGVIPLAQTRSPYSLDRIATDGGRDLVALDEGKLRDAFATMTDAMGSDGARLGEVLDGVTALTDIAAKRDDQLIALIRAARQATSTVTESRQQLFTLMQESSQLLEVLVARRAAIKNLLNLAVRMNRSIVATMDTTAKPVAKALRDLNKVLSVLQKRDASIRRSLAVLAPTVRYLSGAFGNGPYGTFRLASPLPDNVLCASGMVKEC